MARRPSAPNPSARKLHIPVAQAGSLLCRRLPVGQPKSTPPPTILPTSHRQKPHTQPLALQHQSCLVVPSRGRGYPRPRSAGLRPGVARNPAQTQKIAFTDSPSLYPLQPRPKPPLRTHRHLTPWKKGSPGRKGPPAPTTGGGLTCTEWPLPTATPTRRSAYRKNNGKRFEKPPATNTAPHFTRHWRSIKK